MKSIKLRKVGLILAGAVFAGVMVFNAQLVYNNSDQVSGISLEGLVQVAVAQEEEGGGGLCQLYGYKTYPDCAFYQTGCTGDGMKCGNNGSTRCCVEDQISCEEICEGQ